MPRPSKSNNDRLFKKNKFNGKFKGLGVPTGAQLRAWKRALRFGHHQAYQTDWLEVSEEVEEKYER